MHRRDVIKAMVAVGVASPLTRVSAVTIQPHSLIVIHSPMNQEELKRLKDVLVQRTGENNFTLANMPADSTLESLSEAEMNAAGWYRK